MKYKPIYSLLQTPPGSKDGPLGFMDNISGPLGKLQGELDWRLFDFCRIQQIVYKELERTDTALQAFVDSHSQTTPSSLSEEEEYFRSKVFDSVIAKDTEIRNVNAFVDHITIVGLWAIAEQFLGKIYRELVGQLNGVDPITVSAPYRWDESMRKFTIVGIDLTSCENFANANECRVLNNSIKHDPLVSNRLMSFNYFSTYAGQNLISVPLEMQRYLNGVSDFLGSLIGKCNDLLTGV